VTAKIDGIINKGIRAMRLLRGRILEKQLQATRIVTL
jgi:hypothetical protein